MNTYMASVYEGKKAFKCEAYYYSCSQKGHIKKCIASLHAGKKLQI
jgi:hypothetical protein